MTQRRAFGATEGQNVYRDTYVSGAGRVHQGNVYINVSENREDITRDKEKAKAGM